jgi:cytochrome bd-type quinol oxidase subunit 2
MHVNRVAMSSLFALLLGLTSWLEFVQLEGAAFAAGESTQATSGGKLAAEGFLILTALGILGLALSVLGTFMRKRFVAIFGLISSVAVLPMALLYGWSEVSADIANRRIMSITPESWAISVLPFPMVLVTIWFWWRRSRELTVHNAKDI